MEERIQKALGKDAVIRRPPNPDFGDYAVYVGPERAASAAEAIRKELGESASKVEVAGKGFVNITLSRGAVSLALSEADAKGSEWGRGTAEKGQRIMVEYGNPNPFKEMHIGHLMGSIIGEALSRLAESEGATVARDTFGGDVGPHVAKALWGLRARSVTEPANAKEIGEAYAEGSRAYEDDPKAKEEIDALNKAVYAGEDRALMDLWARGREVSMEEFRRL